MAPSCVLLSTILSKWALSSILGLSPQFVVDLMMSSTHDIYVANGNV